MTTQPTEPDSAEEALAALARDLVEEIAAGRALELARVRPYTRIEGGHVEHVHGYIPEPGWAKGQQEYAAKGEAIWAANQWKPRTGAGAVHPGLGSHLLGRPGDTISGHAYKHVPKPQMFPNPNLPGPSLSGQGQQAPLEQPLQGHQAGELLSGPAPAGTKADQVDLYHHTTPESAAQILRTGRMRSPERDENGQPVAFFTTEPGAGSQAGGRGSGVVHVRVPRDLARLEDEFPSGEQHYSVPVKSLRPEHFVREASGPPAGEAAAVKKIAKSPEGFSVNPRTGTEPASGYMVARTGNTHVYPDSVLKDPDKLAKVIDQMIMSGGFPDGTYLGGWVHGGKLWLEPSDNVADKARAERLGKRRNQIAIWDAKHGQEIQTGGSGGGRIIEHDAQGNVVRTYQEGPRADTQGLPEAAGGRAAASRAAAGTGSDQGSPSAGLTPDPKLYQDLTAEAKKARWDYEDDIATNLEYAARLVETAKTDTSWCSYARQYLKRAFDAATAAGETDRALRISKLDDRVKGLDASTAQEGTAQEAMNKEVAKAAKIVPGLFGPHAHENAFNGKVQVVPSGQLDSSNTLAQMNWDGTMKIREDVAKEVQSAIDHPDQPVTDPTQHVVILHELIHGVVPPRSQKANAAAYQDYANAQIEEGFTELGAIHHAPEYFEKMGIGDRPIAGIMSSGPGGSPVDNPDYASLVQKLHAQLRDEAARLRSDEGPHDQATWAQVARHVDSAADDVDNGDTQSAREELQQLVHLGDATASARYKTLTGELDRLDSIPQSKQATMAEYARRIQDPVRIASGDGTQIWGHYPGQVKDAQDWVQQVAKEEGYADLRLGTDGWKRVRQLADQINEQGAAGKVETMARQMAFATVKDPKLRNDVKFMDGLMDSSEEIIHEEWGKDSDLSRAKQAFVSGKHFVKTKVSEAMTSDTYTGATEGQAEAAEKGTGNTGGRVAAEAGVIRKGDRVSGENGKWMATVIEIKNTPNGQSAKVRRDDRKAASWYWVSQLAKVEAA